MHRAIGIGAAMLVAVFAFAASASAAPRLVEAWAAAPVDRAMPMRIVPNTPEQAADPMFTSVANGLGNLLAEHGFNVVGKESQPAVVVLVNYVVQLTAIQPFDRATLVDPVYRALVVTAIDARAPHGVGDIPKVLWQTVVDSYGASSDVRTVIPELVGYGGRYYGQALTPQGLGPARWCADAGAPLGSRIRPYCPAHPGDPPPLPPGNLLSAG